MSQARWIAIIGNFKISETVIVSWFIIAALALVSFFLTRNLKKVPTTKRQVFLEYAVGVLYDMVNNTMGEKVVKRMPNIVPYIRFRHYMSVGINNILYDLLCRCQEKRYGNVQGVT